MSALLQWLGQHSGWEALAVLLGIAYLLLAMRENRWCWVAGFFSTLIYLFLFRDAGLLMESALQLYYLAMAVYGWWHWGQGGDSAGSTLAVRRWPGQFHLRALAALLLLTLGSGMLLSRLEFAAWPYLDSLVTWASVLATWMVAQKLLENWLYWFVIDSICLGLYLDRGLLLTALLFALYLVIVVFGFLQWQRHYREQHAAAPAQSPG